MIRRYSTKSPSFRRVVVVSTARTPIGSFGGSLSNLSATKLGSICVKAAVERAGVRPEQIEEIYVGNVLSANLGQAPARQVALLAGLPHSTVCTTINKVCSSGMKSVMLAAQSIMLGQREIVIGGGMESMSNAPFYVEKTKKGPSYGNVAMNDSLIKDGLWDVYNQQHMGVFAEETGIKYGISREEQDAFAIESYRRAADATKQGKFLQDIVPVNIPQAKGMPDLKVVEDEEFKNINVEKVPKLRSAFKESGSVTAANSSKLSDGASALLLMSEEKAQFLGIKPLARILGFGDAEQDPKEFTTTPALAVPRALNAAGCQKSDISLFEINEAFSVVSIVNQRILQLQSEKVNIAGGAVALGHPIGSSGSRIIGTLIHLLSPGELGCASICNGGGGASSIIIEKL